MCYSTPRHNVELHNASWHTPCRDVLLTGQSHIRTGHPSAPLGLLLLAWAVRRILCFLPAFCRATFQQRIEVTWGPVTQRAHLLRTLPCKFLFKTTCTVMLEVPSAPSALPLQQQKHFCYVQVGFFLLAANSASLLFSTPSMRKSAVQAVAFLLETTPRALRKMYNATHYTCSCVRKLNISGFH